MLFLFILLIVVIAIVAASNSNKSNYSRSIYSRAYTYDDDDNFEREMFDDDIHDTGEIFNRFQDGTCSKSDMELLMEDDDIRDEFYEDY